MKSEEIKKLISFLEKSTLSKLHYKEKDFELFLERDKKPCIVREEKIAEESKNVIVEEADYVKSPMVGTFYSSPSPDHPPFIKEGDHVERYYNHTS